MTPIFPATIKQGKLHFDKPEQFKDYLRSFPDEKRVEVIVARQRKKRSNDQNAWYWGVAVKMIAEETGHEPDEVHDALKREFCPKVVVGNLVAVKGSSKLDTVEFGDNMMEKVVRWAAETLHMVIPMPPERTTV